MDFSDIYPQNTTFYKWSQKIQKYQKLINSTYSWCNPISGSYYLWPYDLRKSLNQTGPWFSYLQIWRSGFIWQSRYKLALKFLNCMICLQISIIMHSTSVRTSLIANWYFYHKVSKAHTKLFITQVTCYNLPQSMKWKNQKGQ